MYGGQEKSTMSLRNIFALYPNMRLQYKQHKMIPKHGIFYDSSQSMGRPTYEADTGPSTWDKAQRQGLERVQKLIPDELHTTTQLPMITPDSALGCVHSCQQSQVVHRPQFWELFSGSSRLALQAYPRGILVLFPVDMSYGWNLADERDLTMENRYAYV